MRKAIIGCIALGAVKHTYNGNILMLYGNTLRLSETIDDPQEIEDEPNYKIKQNLASMILRLTGDILIKSGNILISTADSIEHKN